MTDLKPSKTALKKQQAELQQLGEQLIDIDEAELRAMELDETLLEAVLHAKTIRSNGALRRQRQWIGKCMRNVDAEPIRRALEKRAGTGRSAKRVFASAEKWRDRIVKEGPSAIDAFAEESGGDRDTLDKLYSDYSTALSDRAEKTAKRAIFRHIHDRLSQ